MVAYNFQERFAPLVASGEKRQTIRAPRSGRWGSRHAKPGDPLQLYTGMRTKGCRKLVTPDPVCILVVPLLIEGHAISVIGRCEMLNPTEEGLSAHIPARRGANDELARADGFANFCELRDWFAAMHGLPFGGVLIRWAPT
jgi:hypothetical protein